MTNTLVLDVDGTLVDTNFHHAVAWFRAFRRFDITVPTWRLHRSIGMGGDKLVTAVAGEHVEREHGDELRKAWEVAFEPMLAEIRPLEGAHRLVAAALEQDFAVVLASSGKRHHVDHYLKLIDASGIPSTSSDDVEDTKPAPDLIEVALRRVDRASRAVVIGDSVWDCEAARRAGLPSVCLRTGGFGDAELREAGASAVYEELDELRADLTDLPMA
ncbi:HAD superfamily hydrolase (TIGR01509 family)/HAD superfamily hydrolase (TIGR01549 family) [Saccharothrix carnea]|uniref:HAD superfamily hydrolase (TIGR01509 family)/HAD superfamily hydrolase (TIGR01549 family) n=1 Tax=Saccharothrix carnea TaxID=1280637 RepID=A0A2P8I2Z8_SACCR|nr:HAD family hydrolase [Saccharothrix carnea]PSL52839.1 HAD superfamily hydrolase (TIGR01509 family)/HAD superfamily hydrolase (TIGR01549 family) [Saccharothrix carnea]